MRQASPVATAAITSPPTTTPRELWGARSGRWCGRRLKATSMAAPIPCTELKEHRNGSTSRRRVRGRYRAGSLGPGPGGVASVRRLPERPCAVVVESDPTTYPSHWMIDATNGHGPEDKGGRRQSGGG